VAPAKQVLAGLLNSPRLPVELLEPLPPELVLVVRLLVLAVLQMLLFLLSTVW
jgi:hypothetical protein